MALNVAYIFLGTGTGAGLSTNPRFAAAQLFHCPHQLPRNWIWTLNSPVAFLVPLKYAKMG